MEDLTQKISKSVFIANFPDHFSARDLWNVCGAYGNHKPVMSSEHSPAIVLGESCVSEKDLSCYLVGKIKDINALSNLYVILANEGFNNISLTYLGGYWVLINVESISSKEKLSKHNKAAFAKIVFPWGSLANMDAEDDSSLPFKKVCVVTNHNKIINDKIKTIIKGQLYWIRVKELNAWTPTFRDEGSDTSSSNEEDIDGKANVFDSDKELDHVSESSCMNDYRMKANTQDFDKEVSKKQVSKDEGPTFPPGFTPNVVDDTVDGKMSGINKQLNFDSHTSKNGFSGFTMNFLSLNVQGLGQSTKKNWIRELNRKFKVNFVAIQETKLETINLFANNALWGNTAFDFAISPSVGYSGGLLYVWDPNMFSKESVTNSDLFLAIRGTWISSSTKLLIVSVYAPQDLSLKRSLWEYISHMIDLWEGESIILDDFNEVIAELERFGTTFNRVIRTLRLINGFDKLVEGSWKNLACEDSNNISLLKKKLQALKALIKDWCKEDNHRSKAARSAIQSSVPTCYTWSLSRWKLVKEPYKVKSEFLNHFTNRFSKHSGPKISFGHQMFKQLYDEQKEILESNVTYEEIKKLVWDCGTNKSSGPNGFTFDFIRRNWKIMDQDVVNAVHKFFNSSKFPPRCNFSFITLIPKNPDAKAVKDFHPITPIGCIYKIIAKIMANRLSFVISKLISDVQYAFVANRQILDGPFILNELLSWCNYRKTKAMIFKVDFEKAFDSVRWDFLDDILNKFRFGAKWRGWIQGCHNSFMGSILVNGNPTLKFKFHKGLKQGDPLSPFLFILVMESLHLSFNNILNARLFKGICIDDSLSLSRLFYADDAIFIGISRSRSKFWEDVLVKISSRLSRWKIKTLSIGGHYTLTKSVLSSLPLYDMSIYKVPLGVMESIRRKTFNGIDKDEKKIRPPRGGVEEEKLLGLIDNVDSVILSNSNDRCVWSLESSGEFSVKMARSHIDDFFFLSVGDPTRWIKIVPIKINIFAWKVRLDRLQTRIYLSLRGIDLPSIICPICCCTGETCSHLLFTCNVARRILCKVARWWELDILEFHSYKDWLAWLTSLRLSKRLKEVLEGVFYVMWWLIWKFCN
nr:RNA-directed DNA polymerase, eukaryota, reverse transcriptase zinc-binding domain protein [Tanacetum cinerariifolium]